MSRRASQPSICEWGEPLGTLYVFDTLWDVMDGRVYVDYRARYTAEESAGQMLTHVWDEMITWCVKHARGFWWNDGIKAIAFKDEGDAIRFKLTFI